MGDSSLEVVLSDAATLTELDTSLLEPKTLTELRAKGSITLADLAFYFSGKQFLTVDKGGYTENLLIPAAAVEFGEAGKVEKEIVDRVNAVLNKIKPEWKVG